jgi:(S)-2-hydroxyglutarate dehydrogenase
MRLSEVMYDFCVIGGGIVGLATAYELLTRFPGAGIALMEKEGALGQHQSGHNSGVVHAGIYYKPGSLKAGLCRQGLLDTRRFCEAHGIPHRTPGKLIVACDGAEYLRLLDLERNATLNGIPTRRVSKAELCQLEPYVVGEGALLVRATGIVDYLRMCEVLGSLLSNAGVQVNLACQIKRIRESADFVEISSDDRQWRTRFLIACAGLQSDRVARMSGIEIQHQIVPFRGEYYKVVQQKANLVRHLIYPVPNPRLPFLGVHLTPMISGELTIGPNAVLSFAREKYNKLSINAKDLGEYVRFRGFWRALMENWASGIEETRSSLSKQFFLSRCQKYCPSLTFSDIIPFRAGIRAQAVMTNGALMHDFLLLKSRRILHVANAPSPAATSAFPIARMIANNAVLTEGVPGALGPLQ